MATIKTFQPRQAPGGFTQTSHTRGIDDTDAYHVGHNAKIFWSPHNTTGKAVLLKIVVFL